MPVLIKSVLRKKIHFRKNEVSEMIENKQEISKDLEKALQVLEQAKQRVANEKKKQNES